MDILLGSSMIFAGEFIPRGWIGCLGQIIPISDNQALFSLLGTHYGGNGRSDFGIPDLRGRTPIGVGQGPGLAQDINLGQKTGIDRIPLTLQNLPKHSHSADFTLLRSAGDEITATATATVYAANGAGNQDDAEGGYWATARSGSRTVTDSYSATKDSKMAADAVRVDVKINGSGREVTGGSVKIADAGSSNPVSLMQPSLGMLYIMSTEGNYPMRP